MRPWKKPTIRYQDGEWVCTHVFLSGADAFEGWRQYKARGRSPVDAWCKAKAIESEFLAREIEDARTRERAE